MCPYKSNKLISNFLNRVSWCPYVYEIQTHPSHCRIVLIIKHTLTVTRLLLEMHDKITQSCLYSLSDDEHLVFIFYWRCVSLQILGNKQLDAPFHVFTHFMSLHISSVTSLIIRRSNCINTSSGMISLCKRLLGMPVRKKLPDRHTKQSLTQTKHTRRCINTIRSSDDERCDARNT